MGTSDVLRTFKTSRDFKQNVLRTFKTSRDFKQNGMIANPTKYNAMLLGNANQHNISIESLSKQIPVSKEIKLLGITLDEI